MKQGLFEIITRKNKKRYNYIMQLIEQKNYSALVACGMYDANFGLTNQTYVNQVLSRIEQEISNDVNLLNRFDALARRDYFQERAIRANPQIIERLHFPKKMVMLALDSGYVPSLSFVSSNNRLLYDDDYVDRIFNTIELTPKLIYSDNIFFGKSKAQQKIIQKKPDLLLSLKSTNRTYEQFWLEAFKQGYIPEEALNNLSNNFMLFSRVVKYKPEMVKYCALDDIGQKDQIDELALCMGYIPSIDDLMTNEYIQKSPKLIQPLIKKRPEAINYVKSYFISDNEFNDLVRLAIDNGYMPDVKYIERNRRLADSFDVMKILIQEDPACINMIQQLTPNKEELLKIAIHNGFNGELIPKYKDAFSNEEYENELFKTETAIIYYLSKGVLLDKPPSIGPHNYSMNLYNRFLSLGYNMDSEMILNYFGGNLEVMKKKILQFPAFVTKLDYYWFSRKEIDELCLLAIQNGYVPEFRDNIFGFGSEAAKIMVRKFPNYLEKVALKNKIGMSAKGVCEGYDEICQIALEGGVTIDAQNLPYEYAGSYDIMKKAIPLNPKLIEICFVSDKTKYDELCRLALSYGYEVTTNEYVLTGLGRKLCSNYDIMAKYIEKNPDGILDVELTNSEEMTKLIDIAINSGLKLDSLSKKLQLFLSVDESKWTSYLDDNDIKILQQAKRLYVNNKEIPKTVDPKFLSDNVTSHFTEKQIEILSCYPNLQQKILKILDKNVYSDPKVKIIYEIADKYKDNLEWIPILEKSLDNLLSNDFTNLLEDIKEHGLSPTEKENLIYLLITNNHLDIFNLDELKNMESIRENYINTLIEKNTVESLKAAYCEKIFGIDLTTAINLVHLYGKSLESNTLKSLDEKNQKVMKLLEKIRQILLLNDIEILRFFVEHTNLEIEIKPDLMITFEAQLKYLFTEEFNKSFTKPVQEDKVISNVNGEQDLDIYLAAGHDGKKKCRMMITSLGAYTMQEEPDDYYASWNVDKIASHGCCCSYVGEKHLGTAEIRYCCLGFTDYELGSLHLSGPYDLYSESTEERYQIASTYAPMYLLPDDVLGYTRHTHNETVWERRTISGDAIFKKQPSYIVYFVDNFEDRLSDPEAMKQWESVKKASSNFAVEVDGVKKSLPIMVVEREKIAKSQLEIIHNKLNEFKTTLDSKLIKDIISDYESNYAGNRKFHLNICEKYFPKHEKLSNSVVGQIIETIQQVYKSNPTNAIECINELEDAVKKEEEKYYVIKQGLKQSLPSFDIEQALIDINKLKSNFKLKVDSTLITISNSAGNERQFEQSDISTIDQVILDTQLSSSDVINALTDSGLSTTFVMYENEITEENVNGKLKVHGQRHIKNVLLYSTLIGQSVVQDKHDLDLIMLSAKYHDIGRKTDAFENHAEASAKIAIEKLKDKFSPEDLSIISTIIEFHETPRNGTNVNELFVATARKNGVTEDQMPRVRQMAEVLKDADALDRTRFINKARLKPEFLRYDASKQLIKFASSLQETYAIEDLKQYQCDDAIETLLQVYTPQEVLRTIRHRTKDIFRMEDIQSFIYSWVSANAERLGENYGRK